MATVENCSLADRMDRVYEKDYGYALLIMPSNNAITASTINKWIKPPALQAKTPKTQATIQMTAMM